MCGGCGTGVATAPWEVELFGSARSVRRDIARELSKQAGEHSGLRVEANPFSVGYVVTTGRGKRTLTETLDETVDSLNLEPLGEDQGLHTLETASPAEIAVLLSRCRGLTIRAQHHSRITTPTGVKLVTVTPTAVSVSTPQAP